jgi:hypothetical protein
MILLNSIALVELGQLKFTYITVLKYIYRKVTSIRPVYYSILELFDQRSQYISIKFPLHKPSENLKMCY